MDFKIFEIVPIIVTATLIMKTGITKIACFWEGSNLPHWLFYKYLSIPKENISKKWAQILLFGHDRLTVYNLGYIVLNHLFTGLQKRCCLYKLLGILEMRIQFWRKCLGTLYEQNKRKLMESVISREWRRLGRREGT